MFGRLAADPPRRDELASLLLLRIVAEVVHCRDEVDLLLQCEADALVPVGGATEHTYAADLVQLGELQELPVNEVRGQAVLGVHGIRHVIQARHEAHGLRVLAGPVQLGRVHGDLSSTSGRPRLDRGTSSDPPIHPGRAFARPHVAGEDAFLIRGMSPISDSLKERRQMPPRRSVELAQLEVAPRRSGGSRCQSPSRTSMP